MSDASELRRIAEAATPGPWGWRHFGDDPETACRIVSHSVDPWAVIADEIWIEPDAAFIAAANPTTVIALLDDIERLTRVTYIEEAKAETKTARAERDAARADLAAANARADRTERMHEEDCQENDILRARIDKALALADEWRSAQVRCCGRGLTTMCEFHDPAQNFIDDLDAALAADTPTTATAEPCTCGESVPTATTPGPCYWAENAPGVQSQVHCPPAEEPA